ncbi:hypothetical protein HIM_04845 [Hirsutella minnesotensis 3608]|uniref:Malate dehydrogenase n=1 Tax=Hirsutella minnesotensis 3608 TaxID=1043627 RepID=A0A0F7ZUY8_9HYPO|nr:hypothetical protein HIM_04845 [Hirsutella minnesotensis 3608]
MRSSLLVVHLVAAAAWAVPVSPELGLDGLPQEDSLTDSLAAYFDSIVARVQSSEILTKPLGCDLSKAQMPPGADGLPAPAKGLSVRHVAVARGTQNYTCEAGRGDAVPKAAGAVATLFNASCVAALYPEMLDRIPSMAVRLKMDDRERDNDQVFGKSGVHYFIDQSTAYFNLDTPAMVIGEAPCTTDSSVNPPSTAAAGQKGEKAVTWLRLTTKEGATGGIKEVYRLTTAGGSPPATCADMESSFQVQYAAVYWFWAADQPSDSKPDTLQDEHKVEGAQCRH